MLSKSCPICGSNSLKETNTHIRWQVPIVKCGDCFHQFTTNAKTNEEEDFFSTNSSRAEFYFALISNLNLTKVVDMGTPRDFLFLSKIHNRYPRCECIGLDLYDKPHPSFVKLSHSFDDLGESKVDLFTAFHVLEHVDDVKQAILKIDSLCKWFIIEVPHCDNDKHTLKSSTAPHIHFFSKFSFEKAFESVHCQTAIRTGKDMPKGRSMLVAYRLPSNIKLEKFQDLIVKNTINRVVRGVKRRLKRIIFGDLNPKNPKNCEPRTILPNAGDNYRLSHIASFATRGSNAGDILLPVVLRDLFVSQGGGISWKTLHAHNKVNDKTIKEINDTQGLIIGGGGLFLRDTNKNNISGWQWPCSIEQLESIRVPLCVFAVGYNRFRGQEEFDNIFADNLKVLTEKSVYLGIRNSGSIEAILKYLPPELHHKVIFQPCMTTLISILYPELFKDSEKDHEPFIALNCAFDRDELRFGERKEQLLNEIANGVIKLSKKTGLNIKYYAHYHKDFEMIDILKANNANFEVFNLGKLSPPQIIEAYKAPALVLGMRGHAQMIPFGCQTPILSLVSHDKLQWFLNDISQPHWSVDLKEDNIAEKIIDRGTQILDSKSVVLDTIKNEQQKLWNITQANVKLFFETL